MDTIDQRLQKLKALGAGDKTCEECLQMTAPSMHGIEVCRKCIDDTPAFSDLVGRMMAQRTG
jgi:hypothetical protein